MYGHKKELARPNSLSDYEQMAEAIRNLQKCGDNPDTIEHI